MVDGGEKPGEGVEKSPEILIINPGGETAST